MPAPGAPTLLDSAIQIGTTILLTADAPGLAAFGLGSGWGLYLDGAPAIVFDTFVSIDYVHEWAIMNYPLERGAFESFNKVQLPFNIHAKFATGGSESDREAAISSAEEAANTLDLYDVVTPEAVYLSTNVQHTDYRRTSTSGAGMITIELWLLEIRERVIETSTTNAGQPKGQITINPRGSPTPTSPFDTGVAPVPFMDNAISPTARPTYNVGTVAPIDADFSALSGTGFNVLP